MSSIASFLESPSFEELCKLKKDDILSIARQYELDFRPGMRKAKLIEIVTEHLVDNDLVDESVLRMLTESRPEPRQERREEFDIHRNIRLVPTFHEENVDGYFLHFEKIALSAKWPRDAWPMLLQTALKGKAQEVYTSLSLADCTDYDRLKRAILHNYELVPEAYRQRFRSYQKEEDQTYVEFFRQKETHFNRWTSAKDATFDYERLREMILMEEFKSCIPSELKLFLDERRIDTTYEMAILADEYALTHAGEGNKPQKSSETRSNSQKTSSGKLSQPPSYPWTATKRPMTCHYCGKIGHIAIDCRARKGVQSNETVYKPQGFVTSYQSPAEYNCNGVHKLYKPFVSEGLIYTKDNQKNRRPIKILRDTGASQSLLLKDKIPDVSETATGKSVKMKGIHGKMTNVPIHKVTINSNVVQGPVEVGVVNSLPVKGISMLLGNDLAGEKVVPHPRVMVEPNTHHRSRWSPDKNNQVNLLLPRTKLAYPNQNDERYDQHPNQSNPKYPFSALNRGSHNRGPNPSHRGDQSYPTQTRPAYNERYDGQRQNHYRHGNSSLSWRNAPCCNGYYDHAYDYDKRNNQEKIRSQTFWRRNYQDYESSTNRASPDYGSHGPVNYQHRSNHGGDYTNQRSSYRRYDRPKESWRNDRR